MLDPAYEHIVLVHYRDTEGGSILDPLLDFHRDTLLHAARRRAHTLQNPGSASLSDFHESYQNHSSPRSLEVSSDAAMEKGIDCFNGRNGTGNLRISSNVDTSHVLRRLEEQLSLDDDRIKEYEPLDYQAGVSSNSDGSSLLQDTAFDSGAEEVEVLRIPTYLSQNYAATSEASTRLLDSSLEMPPEVD